MKKSKCSPQIYKKMSPAERIAWDRFYKVMLGMPFLPPNLVITSKQREVIVHNVACAATWELYGIFYEIFNGKKRK